MNLNDFTDDAKVWIFPSSRKFYPNELALIDKKISEFSATWNDNQKIIQNVYKIEYGRFIVVFSATEKHISTEAINQLNDFIATLEKEFDIVLLDRMNACFKQGEFVQYKELSEFKKLIKNRGVNKKTIVFDNTVTTKLEFENYWEVPAEESWYSHLF